MRIPRWKTDLHDTVLTAIGALNFLFVQWVGLRIAVETKETRTGEKYIDSVGIAGFCWPLTGWTTPYKPQRPKLLFSLPV